MISYIIQAINNSISHYDVTAYILHVALEHEPILFHHLKHHVVLKVLDKVQHPLPQSEGRQVPLRGVQRVHLGSLVPDPYTVNNKETSNNHAVSLMMCIIEQHSVTYKLKWKPFTMQLFD